MFEIESIKKTCRSMPSQWEIKLEDGRLVFAHYRRLYFSLQISKNKTNDLNDLDDELFYEWENKHEYPTVEMPTSHMLAHLRVALETLAKA